MPTVILEAFAAAIPVIATDVGAVASLVQNEQTGYLLPRADKKALVRTLNAANSLSFEEWQGYSCRALELSRSEFAPDHVKSMLLNVVAEVGRGASTGNEFASERDSF